MLFLENLKPLKIYKKPLFLPTIPTDKKKRSAIFLLTPNYESSKATMTSNLFVNRLRFASYYIEKDLTYFISSKAMDKVEDVTETYVRDFTEYDLYQSLCEMSAAERNALKDSTFGIPKKRKYPLNDESHVRSAIRFFNYVDKEDEATLARNIKKAIKKFNMKVSVGPKNRFSNYYHPKAVTEEYEYISEDKLPTKERNALEDSSFGVPSKRKFPLNDKDHVKAAIRFFNKVDPEDEKTLAKNLNKAINKFFSKEDRPKVGKNNRFAKYYAGPLTESSIYEGKVYDLGHDDYCYKFFDGDNEVCEVCIDYGDRYDPDNYIYELHVNPAYQKQGIGTALLEYATEVLGGDTLCVEKNNKVALHMYEEAGFEITGTNKQDQYIMSLGEDKLYAKERNALKDSTFGLPEKRKYPLNDESHVRSAIRFFNKVDKEDEAELARNIKKAIKKFGIKVKVGPENRFSNYYTSPATEAALMEVSVLSNIDKDYESKGKKNLSSYRKESITKSTAMRCKDLKHVRLDDETCAFFDGDNLVGYVAVEHKDDYYTWITALEVTKDYQGYGLGNQILKYAIDNMNANALSVNKNNKVAYEMYKKAGFYVFDDTDTMYFMTTDPVKAELNESTSSELDYIKHINDTLNSYDYYIKGAKRGDLDIKDFEIRWRLQSPKEVDKNKFGICWDFACYEDYMLTAANIPHSNYYVLLPDTKYKDTHTFVVAKLDDGRYVYMESSIKRDGIQGLFITNNLNDIFNHVISFMVDHGNDKPKAQKYLIYKYPDITDYGCDASKFESYCTKDEPILKGTMKPGTQDTLQPVAEAALNEGYVKNSNDIYYNKDKYDSGKINLCFVTGHMGSGKSTMAAEMSKDPGTESYCMDDIKFNHNFTDQGLKEYGDLIYSFFKGPGKEFRVSPDDIDINHPPRHSREWSEKAITAFVKFAEDYAKKHKNKKFVIEGIQLYTNIKPEQLKDYAVCIKGTSAVVSAYRATKRDLEKAETKQQKINTAKKKVRYFKSAVTNDEKKIQQWRDYYQKLIDKQVEESAIISEDVIKDEPDIYYNKDKFDNGETNLCFITGHSGSGKSTLADKNKDNKTVVIGLDHALCNIFYTLDDYKKSSDMEYAFYTNPKYNAKYYSDGSDTTKTINGQNFWDYWSDKDYDREACNDFVDFAIKWAKSHKDQKFIIEGIQLYTFIEPEKLKDYAVYIKGTSALKSLFRACKRDSTDYEHKGTKLEKAKDIMHTGKMMIHGAKRGIKGIAGVDKYRKYFGKLTSTNEAVLGYLGVDGKERMSQHTNTPDTAIISASAIITDSEGKILIEDHEKCGGWSLPGGKEENESIEETISRELDEELNIGVDESDLKLICVNTFLCEYPNGSQSYTWFKDYCFYVKNYAGEIENMEPDKHEVLKFVSFEDLLQMRNDNEFMSTLLLNVIDYLEAYNRDIDDLSTDKLTYSGYTTDIDPVCSVINIDFYKDLLDRLGFEISNTYAPKVNIIVCDREDVETGIQQNGELVVNIFIPAIGDKKYNWSIESYEAYIASMMAIGVLKAEFQNVPIGIIRAFSRYILGLEYDETEREFMDSIVKTDSVYNILQSIDKGEITPEDFYRKARKFGCSDKCFADKGSYVIEAKALDAEHLTNTIKYRTSTKQKKEFNAMKKNATDPSAAVEKKDDKEDKLSETDAKKAKTIPKVNTSTEVSKDKITEEMIQALENDEYIIYGDYVTFFTEDSSNDTALRKILWSERMIKRKEVVALLDRVKADCPFIKYAYPELNRYQQKNLFVDLYYYNQAFFKNNEWRALKAFNLYKDLLDRLINDKRIKNAGYERRTVFIPINDWHKNPSTRMWMYKEDLNPISVIYQLMMTNPSALQKLFKDVGVVFFSKDKYFTVDFSQPIDKKTALKFRTFITKINKGEEFDSEDVDSTENTPSKESIKTTIMDDIEDAKGVDLTSANNKVQSEPKEGPNASIGDKPPTRTMAVKTPEAKKEERNKPAVKATAAKPIKPAVTAASLTAAATKKYEKQAEKLVKQQNDEVKDVEKTMSKTTVNKPVTDDKIKQDEEVQKAIVRSIDSHVYDKVDVTDVDDVYDDMDYDDTLKDLLVSLDSMKDDSVNISQARADRMNNLDRELLDKSLKGRTIREILDKDSDPTKPIEMPKTDLKVGSPNPEWKDLHYMNFDKTYDLEKDIVNAFEHFTTTSRPMAIRNITAEDNSSSEDYIDTYTCEYEDYRGKRYTIKLDIPKVKNERFVLRGNKRMLQTQFFNMPIVKTADDVCQIVTNYKKIIISRYNTATGKSLPNVARLIKAADKYNGRRIKFTPGDNTLICTKYNLPIDYIDLSTAFSKIETDEYVIYFNQDEIRKQYEVNDANGTPFAIDKLHDSLIYYPNDETRPFIDTLMAMITWKSDGTIDEKFDELYKSMKAPAKGTYTRAKIMGAEIPLVVVCAYHDGLTTVMKKSNIMYELVDKLTSEIRSDINKDWIRFKDGYLVFNVDYNSSLLMNGLKDCDTIQYSMMDIDDKNMYLDFLDNFGGRIKADGLENFYDCEIDPISKETLAYYKLPTEYVSVLLYANRLLSDNKFIKHTDASSRRARRFELIAAYTYQVLAEAYSSYSTSVKHNRNGATFSCKQSAVIDKILQDPTSSDYSTINMLNDIESTNAITTKGLSGLNADRSYSLDKRTFDDSMLDVVGMSTGFSQNTGITRQATMDMNIKGERGYVKDIHGNTKDMNTAKTLTATEAVVPLSTTHDDPFRVAMTFIQSSKHAVRTEHSDPLLVTNGADEALPYMCSDQFAYKAKQNGTIKELDDQGMIVEYDDGSKEYVDLSETIEKNSDGGFYVPLKLDADSKLKVGSKVKKNQILAYDNSSLSNSAGEDDNLAYNVGTLCKIAIINTDEGFEDSGIVTEDLAEKLTTKIIYMEDCILDKNTNIYNMAKVGQKVEQGDTLLVWQTPYDEEEVNNLLKALADDREAISELGRHTVKSEVTGKVVGIKMYRTVELDDLSDSLKKALSDYEKPISDLKKRLEDEDIDTSTLPANYPLKPAGKLKKAGDGVLIEFYVEYDDIVGVGDKITYNAANKAVIKNVIPRGKEPYTDFRPNEKISALVSSTSIAKRMVTSTRVYGYLQKLMVELDRSCKDMAGIPYDDSTV